MTRLTPKQQAFIENYVLVNNGSEAARLAKYEGANQHVTASRLLRKANIREAIEAKRRVIAEGLKVTEENIIQNLLKEAKEGEKASDRIRAWELLGKYKGMFKENTQIVQGVFANLSEKSKDSKI